MVLDEKTSGHPEKKRVPHFGSFYLRIGAIAFGIGTMVYSGLELGQYFELESGEDNLGCHNVRKFGALGKANSEFRFQVFMLLTPLARMILSIAQMQFICKNFQFSL